MERRRADFLWPWSFPGWDCLFENRSLRWVDEDVIFAVAIWVQCGLFGCENSEAVAQLLVHFDAEWPFHSTHRYSLAVMTVQ